MAKRSRTRAYRIKTDDNGVFPRSVIVRKHNAKEMSFEETRNYMLERMGFWMEAASEKLLAFGLSDDKRAHEVWAAIRRSENSIAIYG